MTNETKLPVKEVNSKGNIYLNVTLKPKWDRVQKKLVPGIMPGEHAVFTKKFMDGREHVSNKIFNKDGSPVVSYGCAATDADGRDVSFWLSPAEHEAFVALGDVGTVFKVTTSTETYTNPMTGAEGTKYNLHFERLE